MGQTQAPAAAGSAAKFVTRVIPLFVFAAAFFTFFPALRNEFVNWDDDWMLLENTSYRGLGWSHLRWMFTTFHAGHYQPLSWITLAIDYHWWGMNPAGLYLKNLLIHAANAVCFYFIARRLLYRAAPARDEGWALIWAALAAALLFAVHPLRVGIRGLGNRAA